MSFYQFYGTTSFAMNSTDDTNHTHEGVEDNDSEVITRNDILTGQFRRLHFKKEHPWKKYYLSNHPRSSAINSIKRSIDSVTMDSVKLFREATLDWFNNRCSPPSPSPEDEPSVKYLFNNSISTRNRLPGSRTPFALYCIIGKGDKNFILSPVHNEIMADDRLDLCFIRLTGNSTNSSNRYEYGNIMEKYLIGDTLCVTQLTRHHETRKNDLVLVDPKELRFPLRKTFWDVHTFFVLDRTVKTNVLISAVEGDYGKMYYVGTGINREIECDHNHVFPSTKVEECDLFLGEVFLPSVQPCRYLKSLKKGESTSEVHLKSLRNVAMMEVPPVLLKARPLTDHYLKLLEIDSDRKDFAKTNRKTAYEAIATFVNHGLSGILAIDGSLTDRNRYVSEVKNIEPGNLMSTLELTLSGVVRSASIDKWARPCGVSITHSEGSFRGNVVGIQEEKIPLTIIVKVRNEVLRDIEAIFEISGNDTIFIIRQEGEETSNSIKTSLLDTKNLHSKIPEGSHADRIIQAMYGGTQIPEPVQLPMKPLPVTKQSTGKTFDLTENQKKYVDLMCNSDSSAVFANSSFGCGKTLTIAAATLEMIEKNENNDNYWIILTAVTNAGAANLVKSLLNIKPTAQIIRLVNRENMERMEKLHQTPADFPNCMDKNFKKFVYRQKEAAELGGTMKTETHTDLEIAIDYLKKNRLIPEEDLRSDGFIKKFTMKPKSKPTDSMIFSTYFNLFKPRIIVGTVFTIFAQFSNVLMYHSEKVKIVQVDEASQIPRFQLLKLLSTFPMARFGIVGDEKQLMPYYNPKASDRLIDTAIRDTLEEISKLKWFPEVKFDTVYRCPTSITTLLGEVFYKSGLNPEYIIDKTDLRLAPLIGSNPKFKFPITMIKFCGKHMESGASLSNEQESSLCFNLVNVLIKWIDPAKIGVLCFYKAQCALVTTVLKNTEVEVLTVDACQGREWPITIVLTTRTSEEHMPINWRTEVEPFGIKFKKRRSMLSDGKRVNVALSRTKCRTFLLAWKPALYSRGRWYQIVEKLSNEQAVFEREEFEQILETLKDTPQSRVTFAKKTHT